MAQNKPFWKSKTLKVNALLIVGGIATYLLGQIEAGATITLSGVLNAVLRIMTKEGITFKK